MGIKCWTSYRERERESCSSNFSMILSTVQLVLIVIADSENCHVCGKKPVSVKEHPGSINLQMTGVRGGEEAQQCCAGMPDTSEWISPIILPLKVELGSTHHAVCLGWGRTSLGSWSLSLILFWSLFGHRCFFRADIFLFEWGLHRLVRIFFLFLFKD